MAARRSNQGAELGETVAHPSDLLRCWSTVDALGVMCWSRGPQADYGARHKDGA